eukprot:COSAG06_NODE_67176_length_252_cov_1.261438_1_plen_39_part_10
MRVATTAAAAGAGAAAAAAAVRQCRLEANYAHQQELDMI